MSEGNSETMRVNGRPEAEPGRTMRHGIETRTRVWGRLEGAVADMPAQDVLVIGLGYVGLPLAVQAARAGFRVTGYDTRAEVVAGLMAGRSHVDDITGAEV